MTALATPISIPIPFHSPPTPPLEDQLSTSLAQALSFGGKPLIQDNKEKAVFVDLPPPAISPAPPPLNSFVPTISNRPTPLPPSVNNILPPVRTGSIISTFREILHDINLDECEEHGENAVFVCDLAEVYRQAVRWRRELGERVEAFFAVKCNPDPLVLHLLARLGFGFDCASQPEIHSILSLSPSLSISPSRIIYANPCKAPSFIRHAARNGVDLMTFDNGDELVKVSKYHPGAKMVLRILTDDSGSLCRLGLKFGAPLTEVRPLLKKAKGLGLDVVGISFHCGSGCTNPLLFGDAVERARWAFNVAREEGFQFDLLDIGGGFEDENFEEIAAVLRESIGRLFPVEEGVRVIAEPGRYFVSRAFELATNIIARRKAREGEGEGDEEEHGEEEEEEKPTVMYYINDGVYGAFNSIMFDHQVVQPHVLTVGERFFESSEEESVGGGKDNWEGCSLWGPTCDSIDCVQPRAVLPVSELSVGDWLRWEKMGAYTICAASQFNGFRRSEVVYTVDGKGDDEVEREVRRLVEA
ncbi:hypothetical protein T439DRAFT_293537 [Meredithblackwellia eburnea MCA 4105]